MTPPVSSAAGSVDSSPEGIPSDPAVAPDSVSSASQLDGPSPRLAATTPIPELNGATSPAAQPRGKMALVIEGGGLRGAFCAGVLAAWDRLAPRPDAIYATSAGAPSAAFMATGQIDVAIRLWETKTHAHHLVSPTHWFKGRPLMDVDKLVNHFRGRLSLDVEQFGNCPTKVFIAVTNCRTATAEYLRLTPGNALDVLTATMALPLAYGRVVNIHGQPYIDGGVVDCIPLERALERGYDHIVVLLTQPAQYRKRRSAVSEVLLRAQYPNYPELPHAFRARWARYNQHVDQIAQLEAAGRIKVIRPESRLPASRMTRDRRKILETIQMGRDCAKRWLDEHPELLR